MQITQTNPNDFINSLPAQQNTEVALLDKEITKLAAGRSRVMWEGVFWGGSAQKIIGYGDLQYTASNKKVVNWFVVGLAQQKNYITVFVNVVDGGKYLAEKYKLQLGKAKVGKSSISFKKVSDINLAKLLELVTKAFQLTN